MYEKIEHFLDGFLSLGIPGYDCMICHNGANFKSLKKEAKSLV